MLAVPLVLGLIVVLATPASASAFRNDWNICADVRANPDRAVEACTRLLVAGGLDDSKSAAVMNNRGYAHVRAGRFAIAVRHFDEALRLDPKQASTYNYRGIAFRSMGRFDRAVQDFGEAVRLDPAFAQAYYNRGVLHRIRGDLRSAIEDFRKAIEADRYYAKAFNDVAWLLATAPDHIDADEALRLAQRAVDLSDGPGMRDTLAAAYAALDRFEDAVREQRRAIQMAASHGALHMVGDFTTRLRKYEAGEAFVSPRPRQARADGEIRVPGGL